ncbi:MAG TPA: anhydro-N-acetylmuramic acid kinase [Urbifossiella sp.]|nr:anhydro-N-acetylmuramic acid kinase [Urbifossiella sp.]
MPRAFLGLSVGSGLEGLDAALVRGGGVGLALAPRCERSVRIPFAPAVLDSLRPGANRKLHRSDLARGIAEAAVHAVRSLAVQAGLSSRDVFAAGFLEPAHPAGELPVSWPEVAARIAEATDLTVIHGFRDRDRAADGSGHPITAVADFLIFQHDREDRLLVNLGAVSSVLFIAGGTKIAKIHGFESGPGGQWLDAILFHGSRGKEQADFSGKKAVQGRCLDGLLARWLEHPHFARKPPKAVGPDAFGPAFLQASFEFARTINASLVDVLCTANHLIARSIGDAWRTLLPPTTGPVRVLLTGGGVRNGFLRQLLGQQLEGLAIGQIEELGVPASARKAAAAAVLASLTCDGVAGNLAPLTGATAGRLLGSIVPGDARHWARCAAWLAEQSGDLARNPRAA